MKRADYNEFLYIRSTIRKDQKNGTRPIMWHIRTDYSAELKQPGQKDRITKNVFYTAIWGESAAEAEAAETGESAVG